MASLSEFNRQQHIALVKSRFEEIKALMESTQELLNLRYDVCDCCNTKRYRSWNDSLAHSSLQGMITKFGKWLKIMEEGSWNAS